MSLVSILFARLAKIAAALALFLSAPAFAAVEITFYSKELGSSFPHAFVIIEGTPDRGGEPVTEDYGFTAKSVTPAILWGKVGGKVISDHSKSYVESSDKHFTLTLSDAEYDSAIAVVERWRARPQPSYDLDKSNCIHFVAEIAAAIGMQVDTKKFMKKPRSWMEALTRANLDWLRGRSATLHRSAAKPPSA